MKQCTIKSPCVFKGKGIHSGKAVEMTVLPALENHGIVFQRIDLPGLPCVKAEISNVYKVKRSTSLRYGKAKVRTTEHLLAALFCLGIDNALIQLDSEELPIMDGSSAKFVEEFLNVGIMEQNAEREYAAVCEKIVCEDPKSGSRIEIEPADEELFDVTIDFNSRVVGIQRANLDKNVNFAEEIAPCRTFCFFKDVRPLLALGLIKGGDLENALVIDEPKGYLNDTPLRFENECARHKLLDLAGDFCLAGKHLKCKVTAYKPGHKINTEAVMALVKKLNDE